MSPLDNSLRKDLLVEDAASSIEKIGSGLGQGISLAVLGGYRSLVANLIWMSMNGVWEKRDYDATFARIRLSTSVDPRPELFWLNGARIIYNDMPAWQAGDHLAGRLNTTRQGKEIQKRYAQEALAFLDSSLSIHLHSPNIHIERAVIHWRKLDDLEKAAELFLHASKLPDAPYYAARVYAELLVGLGKKREALGFLEELYLTLPDNDILARKNVVELKIRNLRKELDKVE